MLDLTGLWNISEFSESLHGFWRVLCLTSILRWLLAGCVGRGTAEVKPQKWNEGVGGGDTAVDMHARDDSNAEGESPGWIWKEGEKQPFRWVGRIPLARRRA